MATILGTPLDDNFPDDAISGTTGDDSIFALSGDDAVFASLGADFLDGGPGRDVLLYEPIGSGGVIINDTADTAFGAAPFTVIKPDGSIDSILGFELFHGTAGDDVILVGRTPLEPGVSQRTYTFDRGGDDRVVAPQDTSLPGGGHSFLAGSGNDTFVGSVAEDQIVFQWDGLDSAGAVTRGVTVDLETGLATDGWGFSDQLQRIEHVAGTEFGDLIHGDAAGNILEGLDGDDTLHGRDGDDSLDGGAGADELRGGEGDDTLLGGSGQDWAYYEPGDDSIDGGDDFDRLDYRDAPGGVTVDLAANTASDGGGGTDAVFGIERVIGSLFDDRLTGDAGDNVLTGEAGDDTIDGGEGSDLIWYGRAPGAVTVDLASGVVSGAAGDDRLDRIERITGSNYGDRLFGDDEDNFFTPDLSADVFSPNFDTGGADTIDGRGGHDTVSYQAADGPVTVNLRNGTATDARGNTDTLSSIEAARGGAGDDRLSGSGADEALRGNDGSDRLLGRGGQDTLEGGAGADRLVGGGGHDIVTGDAGRDVIRGGGGRDDLSGGGGRDLIEGGRGRDSLDGAAGRDRLFGDGGGDRVSGANGRDRIEGGGGNDRLKGGAGHDTLSGGSGRDTILGGNGSDRIEGGRGPDVMRAGNDAAQDVFVFIAATDSDPGGRIDRIVQFDSGEDVLDFRAVDADTRLAGDQAFVFAQGPEANGLWLTDTGPHVLVEADVDGDAIADMAVRLMRTDVVTADDMIL